MKILWFKIIRYATVKWFKAIVNPSKLEHKIRHETEIVSILSNSILELMEYNRVRERKFAVTYWMTILAESWDSKKPIVETADYELNGVTHKAFPADEWNF